LKQWQSYGVTEATPRRPGRGLGAVVNQINFRRETSVDASVTEARHGDKEGPEEAGE
jgi:hypothetical protein